METLASIYVTLVSFFHLLVPQADLPKVLGVQIAEDTNQVLQVSSSPLPSGLNVSAGEVESSPKPSGQPFANGRGEINLSAIREAAQRRFADKKDEFETRVAAIKDQKKSAVVKNLVDRFDLINQKWVTHWNEVLTRLSSILTKIETRTDKAEAAGKDVSSVRPAIESAKTAILTAKSAVTTQAGKVYTVNITTEDKLGEAVKGEITTIRSDTKVVFDSLTAAREAVNKALKALIAVVGVDEPEKSPKPTPADFKLNPNDTNIRQGVGE